MKKTNDKKMTVPAKPAKSFPINWKIFLLIVSIASITFFSFSSVIKNDFISWDDNYGICKNKDITKPIAEAIEYFFEPHYVLGNYIPLTMITYTLEYHIAGLEPQFFHTVSIIIHLANVILVFWFIYLLSGRKTGVAALVSLFFGIHPMHVESVAWASELKDVLYSFFFISGLISYCIYTEREYGKLNTIPGINLKMNEQGLAHKRLFSRLPVLTFVFFVLSILSKPAAVVFPVVILLLDFYNKRKFDKWVLIEKLPFFIVSIIFGIIAIKAQQSDHLIRNYYPFSQKLCFASYSFLAYLVKVFLPMNLSIFYPYPPIVNGHLPYYYYIAPAVVIILFYGIYRTLRYTRLIMFGVFFFLVNVMLVLQLLSVGDAIMADRYTYIPYIGLFFTIAMGLDHLYYSKKSKFKTYKPYVTTMAITLAIICSYYTNARCKVWENDNTMDTDLFNKYPDSPIALCNKGYLLVEQEKYDESLKYFAKAVQLDPDYCTAYYDWITSYIALKDYDNAFRIIGLALKFFPDDGNILADEGNVLYLDHKYPEAIKANKEAIQLYKYNIPAYVYLANCYFELKDYEASLNTIDTALKYDPDNYSLLNNKGASLLSMNQYGAAAEYFKASLKINPDFVTASVNLSNCYRAMKDSIKIEN